MLARIRWGEKFRIRWGGFYSGWQINKKTRFQINKTRFQIAKTSFPNQGCVFSNFNFCHERRPGRIHFRQKPFWLCRSISIKQNAWHRFLQKHNLKTKFNKKSKRRKLYQTWRFRESQANENTHNSYYFSCLPFYL